MGSLFKCCPTGFGLGPCRRCGERVAEKVERDSPIRDRTTRVLLQNSLERPARVDEPIRMDHRDAALELGLYLGIAGGGETQLAELLVLLSEGAAAQRCGDASDKYQILRLHGYLRVRAILHRPTQWIASKRDFANEMPAHAVSPYRSRSGIRHRPLVHVTPALHICGVLFAYH